jgi:hypothetical protein
MKTRWWREKKRKKKKRKKKRKKKKQKETYSLKHTNICWHCWVVG